MKKYKLIKEYPSSPKLDTIASQRYSVSNEKLSRIYEYDYVLSDSFHQPLPKNKVEDFPEFWERVSDSIGQEPYVWKLYTPKEEPNYLITAFRFKDYENIWYLKKDGLYGTNTKARYTLNQMLKGESSVEDGIIEIYSVKNSKGEEFTIGDMAFFKTTLEWQNVTSKILKFDLLENFILVTTEDRQGNIEYLFKDNVKKLIYTTTDNAEMFGGDIRKIYLLNHDLSTPSINEVTVNWNLTDKETADRYLTFTSEENRDKYIKENQRKPIFVSADGKDMYEGDKYYVPQIDGKCQLIGSYMDFTVDTRTLGKGPLKFSTKEAAKEYIDNNKPKFSLKEIESCYPSPTNSPLFTTFIANLKKLGK